jgi:ribA/ribD-fused uncharacterized protein
VTVLSPHDRLAAVLRREVVGDHPDLLFFWRATPGGSGRPGPGCLSQFWTAPFTVDGVTYRSAEHWMMAEKARLFGDNRARDAVLASPTSPEAKAAGRTVRGFSEAAWGAARYGVVVAGNLAKFSQHDDLRRYLVSTDPRVLVEASPSDPVWGIGLAEADERAPRPSQWQGTNLLGFALMEVREQLS